MPVKKDDPIYELRKKLVNKKDAEPSKQQKIKHEQTPHAVIPAKEFKKSLDRARELCKSLIAAKKKMGTGKKAQEKELGGAYKRNAKELGVLLSGIVATIKSLSATVTSSRAKAELIAGSRLPEAAIKAGVDVVNQLNGAQRRIRELNNMIGEEIKKSKRGLEPRSIQGYLRDIESIYDTAESARISADKLYQQWGPHINPGKKIERRAGLKQGPGVVPKFVVAPDVVVFGEAKTAKDKATLAKLVKAKNLGGTDFPDPYTVLWNYYGNKSLKLDTRVRDVVRYSIMYVARQTKQPSNLKTVLELYRNGDLLKNDAGKKSDHFDATDFNENFRIVHEYIARKMKKDPKLKDFVFKLDQNADDGVFEIAKVHMQRGDSRGYSLTDNARKQYIEACRNWFTTYMPVL